MHKNKQEMQNLNAGQLREKINGLRQELFVLRLNAPTAHIKDYSQFKKLRRAIACALTYLGQKSSVKPDINQ